LNECGIRRPSAVKDQDGDHGLFFTDRAAVRVVVQVLGADVSPVLLLLFVIHTVQLLVNEWLEHRDLPG
jgi:hypothetical protein